MAESHLNCSFECFEKIQVLVSRLVNCPSDIQSIIDLLKQGRMDKKLVIILNDYGDASVKRSLERNLPSSYKQLIREFDQVVKSNTVSV